ncbi:MAG: hypothetical protein LBK07_08240 [Tannerella sp.]|jgi:hypothetical protein|nr:hypothetical protein [Tannerella sp.]
MDSKRNFVPESDAKFSPWVNHLMLWLGSRIVTYGLNEVDYKALNDLLTVWNTKYAIASAPETATKAATRDKNEARAALESALRAFLLEEVTYNRIISDADRENMALPIHKKTRTPARIPISFPAMAREEMVAPGVVKFHFIDSITQDSGKPDEVARLEMVFVISDVEPVSVDELVHSITSTHTTVERVFDGTQRGKTFYYAVRWENTRGQKGPFGPILSIIIP